MGTVTEESCWWSSIPASKRASHVIIIGFLCMSLAAGLSHEGELRSSRQHADTRQHHNQPHHIADNLRDANSDNTFLENLFNTKHSSQQKDSARRNVNLSNNILNNNEVKLVADSTSSSSLSLLRSSVLSRSNSSSSTASSGLNRAREGERLRSRGPGSGDSVPHHHLRPASHPDASSSRRVRRRARAGNRGTHFIYKPKAMLQLFCRTNYRLAIHEDGTINGTKDNMDVYSSLYIQSQRRSYVSIKGVRSQKYVCVDSNGQLFGADRVSRNCFFQESIEENFFNTYAFTMTHSSSKRRNKRTFYLSINKDGVSRIAKVRSQKKSQFISLTPPPKLL